MLVFGLFGFYGLVFLVCWMVHAWLFATWFCLGWVCLFCLAFRGLSLGFGWYVGLFVLVVWVLLVCGRFVRVYGLRVFELIVRLGC